MNNSSLENIIQHDIEISNVIKNWPERAHTLLMQQYLISREKEVFVSALIGQLCVMHSMKKLQGGV
ncbi:hypothetical protein JD974_12460 [Chromobacterium haemolyticum]|uniref:Uncharacterized protein n=1 Tax=Chromobacterium haemolyticum TaxID=394935 RepID=A0ABS3GND3_9NEIS|nr:hypothetical protein [Chromobacterium haemolyticum]MBK0415218.1 hypothetical protein [Chromobacterium haemolyticum]MBO0416567.1 hypothetical protein [Chromobacterium haemolyticum]MBO0499857.1 hypothetical protein [Chromobacterium haemolyticum]